MTATARGWQLEAEVAASLPPLAWVARADARPRSRRLRNLGAARRRTRSSKAPGRARRRSDSLPDQTTIFGSGLIVAATSLSSSRRAITSRAFTAPMSPTAQLCCPTRSPERCRSAAWSLIPTSTTHTLLSRGPGPLAVSSRTSRPPCRDPIEGALQPIPTTTNSLTTHYFENAVVATTWQSACGESRASDHSCLSTTTGSGLLAATRSLFENAGAYEPVVSLSGGYDSTAVAVSGRRGRLHARRRIRVVTACAQRRLDGGQRTGQPRRGLGLSYHVYRPPGVPVRRGHAGGRVPVDGNGRRGNHVQGNRSESCIDPRC